MTFSLEQAMRFDWTPVITAVDDVPGCFALRVPPVSDFVIYGATEAQLLTEWRDALESHLGAYVAVGKAIPLPMHIAVRSTMDPVITEGAPSWSKFFVKDDAVTGVDAPDRETAGA